MLDTFPKLLELLFDDIVPVGGGEGGLVRLEVGRRGGIRGDGQRCGGCILGDVEFGGRRGNGRNGAEEFLLGVER
jgi:hypothetical protein